MPNIIAVKIPNRRASNNRKIRNIVVAAGEYEVQSEKRIKIQELHWVTFDIIILKYSHNCKQLVVDSSVDFKVGAPNMTHPKLMLQH